MAADDSGPDLTIVITTLQNMVQAVNNLNTTISAVFPRTTGTTTSATAGAASALPALPSGYMNVTLPDGTVALVPFYNP